MNSPNRPFTVIVLREPKQSIDLEKKLLQTGFLTLSCPTFRTEEMTEDIPSSAIQLAQFLEAPLFAAIFTSHAAVSTTFSVLKSHAGIHCVSESLNPAHWFGIGSKTAETLTRLLLTEMTPSQCPEVLTGEFPHSASLLNHRLLQSIEGQTILLCQGKDGLDLIQNALAHRGAIIKTLRTYARIPQRPQTLEALQALLKQPNAPACLLAHSVTGLTNLVNLVDPECKPNLFKLPVIAASERIAQAAETLGFTNTPHIAQNTSTDAMISRIRNLSFFK